MKRSLTWWPGLLLGLLLWAFPAGGQAPPGGQPPLPTAVLLVGGERLVVELPRTGRERMAGLAGRAGLAEGRGMAFIQQPPAQMAMVMQGMRFALDFLWCREGKVAAISRRVPPDPQGRFSYPSPGPVELVVELPAGWAEAHGVGVGTPVRLLP